MYGRKIPTLLELCVQTTIDNVRYLRDVGETDIDLLGEILPHCKVDHLMHIEKSTIERDLSPVTDKLWRKFYEKHFGAESTKTLIERMNKRKVSFKWMQLYEAKQKDLENVQEEYGNKLKELYKKEQNRRQSRQIQVVTKVSPANNSSNTKGRLIKEAKMEFLNSHEARTTTMKKRNLLSNQHIPPRTMTPPALFGGQSSSGSGLAKPFPRRS
ncbi:hypothetical protein MKX01_038858 [Papaver californicum]|nr:hypothetical protein MKX01_038858 [Papaver californicum]